MASDQLRRFADQIRQKGVTDMLDDVHNFARRRPALFIGGAFLIGIGIARFLKSSAERQAYHERESGFSSVDPMTTSSVPPYGSGSYGDDKNRRAIVAPLVVGCLQNDINTGACVTP